MAEDRKPSGTGRALKWALALSLALNLLIVGFAAGAAWRFAGKEGEHRRWGPDRGISGAPFVRALPRDARRALGRAMHDDLGGLPPRGARHALYGQMVAALRAEPFDEGAVADILRTQADTAQALQGAAQQAWLRIVSEMSAVERAEVADRLEEGLRRHRERGLQRP
ncbi:periplasmic heavy metal sensor [Marimonas sp. MJW-29]|uniref:Periplasmic heavy metal sensor n=1 Tax=Sulfitobacter sediminis TaxID=3234186 RepID=A0ABV3RLE8_9RHOB